MLYSYKSHPIEYFVTGIKGAPVDNWQALPNTAHCGALLRLSQNHTAFIPVYINFHLFVALGQDLCYRHQFKLWFEYIFSSKSCRFLMLGYDSVLLHEESDTRLNNETNR